MILVPIHPLDNSLPLDLKLTEIRKNTVVLRVPCHMRVYSLSIRIIELNYFFKLKDKSYSLSNCSLLLPCLHHVEQVSVPTKSSMLSSFGQNFLS